MGSSGLMAIGVGEGTDRWNVDAALVKHQHGWSCRDGRRCHRRCFFSWRWLLRRGFSQIIKNRTSDGDTALANTQVKEFI
ncbi:MAG: hypothetical protein KatS3mg111_2785 [Pirellulaceae bacterium]|nr:MAG: hypothetical protein KatS3mg111_2785 [Pirellulaceae bacterium]